MKSAYSLFQLQIWMPCGLGGISRSTLEATEPGYLIAFDGLLYNAAEGGVHHVQAVAEVAPRRLKVLLDRLQVGLHGALQLLGVAAHHLGTRPGP